MTLFRDFFRRLISAWPWLLAQFFGTLALLFLGLAWTRLSEKNFLLVAATLLLPLLLTAAFLVLEAGTLRAFAQDPQSRIRLVWGSLWLLFAALLFWIGWGLCDSFAAHTTAWASYLNAQSLAHTRLFTYDRYARAIALCEWILRWILVPALLLPLALSLAQWGRRIPWRRVMRLLIDWKWWLGIAFTSLLAELIPSFFFTAPPYGSISAQKWHVGLKLAGAFLLKLSGLILALGWLSALFHRIPQTARSREAELFCRNLRSGRRFVAGAMGAILLVNLPVWPLTGSSDSSTASQIATGIRIALFAAVFILLILYFRTMFPTLEKRTKLYWGILACIVWLGITAGVTSLDGKFPLPLLRWQWGDFVTFLIFSPFVASAAVWGWLLPWKRIGKLFLDPRWLAAGFATFFAETYLASQIAELFVSPAANGAVSHLHDFLAMTLSLGIVVLQLAWLAALLAPLEFASPTEDALVAVGAGSGDPQRSSSIKLDLPE
ncbi:MAG: hypothetical protein P4L99_23315 [Chthoniobacter sp.]|nr:hypothetical protein [Chthoniobacter sp.]